MARYNNYNDGFSAGTPNGRASRNPYWLSAGRETPDGQILFSQPEIVVYGVEASDQRPGYPDFIEDVDGSIWISETQKSASRVHPLPASFLEMLWGQKDAASRITAGLAANVTRPAAAQRSVLPSGTFANLQSNSSSSSSGGSQAQNITWPGFTLDFWLALDAPALGGRLLASAATDNSGSLEVALSGAGNVTLSMTDARGHSFTLGLDRGCAAAVAANRGQAHYVAFLIDGGAAIGSAMVDGKLCDGSMQQ